MQRIGIGKTNTEQRKVFAETMQQTPKGKLALAFEQQEAAQGDDKRPDGTVKGKGFFGELPVKGGGVATEYSVGVQLESRGGAETDIPSLVPTLTKKERDLLLNDIIPNKKLIPESIVQKAVDHANARVKAGKNVFAQEGESVADTLRRNVGAAGGGSGMMSGAGPRDFTGAFGRFGRGVKEDPFSKLGPVGTMIDTTEKIRLVRQSNFLNNPDTDWEAVADEQKRALTNKFNQPGLVGMSKSEYTTRLKSITPESVKKNMEGEFNSYVKRIEEQQKLTGVAANVGRIVSAMPSYMLDFYLTGGAAKTVSVPIKRAIRQTVKSKVAARVAAWTVRATTRAVISPHRVFNEAAQRELTTEESPIKALGMAFLSTAIEYGSEELGSTIGRAGLSKAGFRKVKGKFTGTMPAAMKSVLGRIEKVWTKLSPNNTKARFARKLLRQGGINGVVGEIGEEKMASMMHAVVGTQYFGLGPDATIGERFTEAVNQMLSAEQLGTEALAFSVFPAGTAAAGQVGRISNKRKLRKIAKEVGVPIKGLTPEAAVKKIKEAITPPTATAVAPEPSIQTEKAAEPTIPPTEGNAESAQEAGEVDVELYIGNVTLGMKKRITKGTKLKAKDVQGFKKGAFPTKRTNIKMTRSEADSYREFLESDLLRRLEENEIRTDNDVAKASADFGDIKNLRAALGMKADIRMPFKVIRAKQKDVAVRDQGEIDTLSKELKALDKQLQKAKTEASQQPILSQIKEKEEFLSQLQKTKGKAIKVIKDTKSAIFQALRGETESKLTMSQALNIVMKRSAQFASRAHTAAGKELVAKHKALLDFAKRELPAEFNLLKRAATRIVKSRTPSQMKAVEPAIKKMVEQFEKGQAIKEVQAAIKKARARKLTPEFEKMLIGLEGISLKTSRADTLKRMEILLEAAERQEYEIGEIPQKLIDKAKQILSDTTKPTLKDFPFGELQVLTDAIGNIIHQDTLKKELLFTKSKRTVDENNKEASEAVTTRWGAKHKIEAGKFDKQGQKRALRKGWEAVKRIAHWDQLNLWAKSRILGGRGGVAEKLLADNLVTGNRFVTEVGIDSVKYISNLFEKLGVDKATQLKWSQAIGGKKSKVISVAMPEARSEDGNRVKDIEMTVAERISIIRFIADAENRAALLDNKNKGIVFSRDKSKTAIKLTTKDLQAIVDSASTTEKVIAERMVDYTNSNAPGSIDIGQKVKDVWQTLMGFPLRTHTNYVSRWRSEEHRDYDPTHTTKNYVERRLERMGIFKKRGESKAPFVIGDAFAEFHADVNRMASFAGKALAVHDAKMLLNDLNFRRSVKEAFKHGAALLTDLEQSIEFYQGLDQPFQGDIETFAKGLLRKAHVGALAAKPHIVLYQTVSLLNANAVGMDAKYLYNPVHFRPSELKRIRGILNKNSAEMEARDLGGSYQILTPASAGPTLKQMYGHENKRLKAIHAADGKVMELIGLAAEAEGKKKGKSGNELNEYIARRTEEIVLESQPSWDATTLSSLAREGRGSAFKHMLVMFSSQRNKNLNMVTNAVNDYLFSNKSTAEKAKLAHKVAIPTIANATLIYGISEAYWFGLKSIAKLLGFRPKDDDKDWKAHIAGIMERMAGNWIIVGDIASSGMVNYFKGLGGTPSVFKRNRGTILGEALGEAMAAVVELGKFTAETAKDERYKSGPKKGQRKNIDTLWRGLEKVGRSVGVFAGLPLQGMLQIASPFMPHRQEQGEEEEGAPFVP